MHLVGRVAEEDRTTAEPGIEKLLLEHDFGGELFGGLVNELSQGAPAGQHKVAHLFDHLLRRLGSPLCVAEAIVQFARFDVQMFNNLIEKR